jgi:hypothetical protein
MGVAHHRGRLYIADTYNNKIKVLDLAAKTCRTLLGDGLPGNDDDPPRFQEPAGLCVAGDQLFVADTNNHCIRIVDLNSNEVTTLKLEGVQPPREFSAPRDSRSGRQSQAGIAPVGKAH